MATLHSGERKKDHDQNTLKLAKMTRGSKPTRWGLKCVSPCTYLGMENVIEVEETVYTVEDAVNYMGFGVFQILVTFFSGFIWVRGKKSFAL